MYDFSHSPTIYFMIGIPGAGKSTLARKLCDLIGHDIHYENMDTRRIAKPGANKVGLWHESFAAVKECNQQPGTSIVIDNTNLLYRLRLPYFKALHATPLKNKKRIVGIWLQTPLDVCLERNATRVGNAKVPVNVIHNMHKIFQQPKLTEGFDRIIIHETQST